MRSDRWRGIGAIVGAVWLAVGWSLVFAAEHGGQEHGGQEHAGQEHAGTAALPSETIEQQVKAAAPAVPSAEQIRERIAVYVKERSAGAGAFSIKDDVTGATRNLKFVRVHNRVGKTGAYYYSCTDMQDVKTGELLDLDFDVDAKGGTLNVVEARIHKVAGKARYTYDAQDRRIPVR